MPPVKIPAASLAAGSLTAYALAVSEASAADCLPCKIRREAETHQHAASGAPSRERLTFAELEVDPQAPASDAQLATWHGVIVQEGVMTGDGRMIDRNALRWENLPILLRWTREDNGEHLGAMAVGRILTLERQASGDIAATGDFDLGSPEGREAARQVGKKLTNGVSVDLDEVSFEIRVAKELLAEATEPIMLAEDPDTEASTDDEGRVTVLDMDADSEVMVTDDARIRAATLVQVPAFAAASIELDDPDAVLAQLEPGAVTETDDEDPDDDNAPEADDETDADDTDDDLVASGAIPIRPPAEWFQDPQLTEITPLTITEDGRIYGHLAEFGTCHIAYEHCVQPPHSPSGYSYFKTGSILTAEGTEIPVGRITMDTMHAKKNASATDALSHYEHTGRIAAEVTAGDDAHGIWISGAIRRKLSEDQLRSLRSSPLSGDWRRIGGQLELVAALAVNVAGFPIPRPQGLVASGVTTSLVASGMIPPRRVRNPELPGALSLDDLRYLKRLAAKERRAHQVDQAAKLAARVNAGALAMQVNHRSPATANYTRKK